MNEQENQQKTTNASLDGEQSLRRFAPLLQYLAYENTTYWTRAKFFLLGEVALIGFVSTQLPTSLVGVSYTRLAVLFVGALVGLLMAILWIYGLKAGQLWISHWTRALQTWEKAAFGGVNLFLERPKDVVSATRIARMTAWLFVTLWSLVGVFLIVCWLLKSQGCNLP